MDTMDTLDDTVFNTTSIQGEIIEGRPTNDSRCEICNP